MKSITFQKIHLLNENNDVYYIKTNCITCTFALLFTNKAFRAFPTYFKRTSDPCGEITLSRSRKFSSRANLTVVPFVQNKTEAVLSNENSS